MNHLTQSERLRTWRELKWDIRIFFDKVKLLGWESIPDTKKALVKFYKEVSEQERRDKNGHS